MSNSDKNRRDELERRIANLTEEGIGQEDIEALLDGRERPDVLERVVEIVDEYRRSYSDRIQDVAQQASITEEEDAAAVALDLPAVEELLEIAERIEYFRRQMVQELYIPTEELLDIQESTPREPRENMTVVDDIHTPPDEWQKPTGDGTGMEWNTEFSERLTALRYLLYTLDIDPNDPKQVTMQIGRIGEDMVRQVSYVSVYIRSLNKIVELCNQVDNRTFIWNSKDDQDVNRYADMGKEEKKQLQTDQPETGWQVIMSEGWMERLEKILTQQGGAEEAGTDEPRILRDMKEREEAAVIVRDILELKGVVHIEERAVEGGTKEEMESVLVWIKRISPGTKSIKYPSHFYTYLGRAIGVNGKKEYTSFASMIDPLRSLFEGRYEREVDRNAEIVCDILEREGVVSIVSEPIEGNSDEAVERLLEWKRIFRPGSKYCEYPYTFNTYLSRATNIKSGKLESFSSIIEPVQSLFAGRYDREIGNPNLLGRKRRGSESHPQQKEAAIAACKDILERAGVLRIEERSVENGMDEEKKKVLVWSNTRITPQESYFEYQSNLNVLLGRATGVDGFVNYKNFASMIEPIRALYHDECDEEENEPNDNKIAKAILESEGVTRIEERVLVWGTNKINPRNRYGGYPYSLATYIGNANDVNGAEKCRTFKDSMPHIRKLYAGEYDSEDLSRLSL